MKLSILFIDKINIIVQKQYILRIYIRVNRAEGTHRPLPSPGLPVSAGDKLHPLTAACIHPLPVSVHRGQTALAYMYLHPMPAGPCPPQGRKYI